VGLPGYSSHSYSLTVETELSDLASLERESSKLYAILQGSVDREIQEVGFIPDGNGHGSSPRTTNGPASHLQGQTEGGVRHQVAGGAARSTDRVGW
jgi:hypothetical protein